MHLVHGNLSNPDLVVIPSIQTPLSQGDPIVYGRGQSFTVHVKFPSGTKKLLFTISERVYGKQSQVFQSIVFPQNGQGGVAQFDVGADVTSRMHEGLYHFDVFQLRDDGSKEIWLPYNTGTFSIVDYPSSTTIVLETKKLLDDDRSWNPPVVEYNIDLIQGQPWSKAIRWSSGGTLVNLTGYVADMFIKPNMETGDVTFSLTVGNSHVVIDEENSLITFSLSGEDIATIPVGTYVYIMQAHNANYSETFNKTLLRGYVSVTAGS